MRINYLQSNIEGHLYQMTLFPTTCDLDIQVVSQRLNLIEKVSDSVHPFLFEVTKNGPNNYSLRLFLQKSIMNSQILKAELSFLTTEMSVPRFFKSYENTEDIILATKITIASMTGVALVSSLSLEVAASVWSLISFQQFVGYFLFLNIPYPPQTELFFQLIRFSIFEYLFDPIVGRVEPLLPNFYAQKDSLHNKYLPPHKLLYYDYTSFFIDNGGLLFILNLTLHLILMITLCLKSMKRFENSIFLKKIKVTLRWNMIARLFLENAIPLTFAICLQLRVLKFEGDYLSVNGILTIISLIFSLFMTAFLWRVLIKRDNDLLKKKLIKRIFGTLYEGINLNKSASKYFYMVILMRTFLLIFLIVFLENRPLLQILTLIFFNIGFIHYLVKQVHFDKPVFDKIVKIKEILVLLGEVGIMLLAPQIESEDYYQIVGWTTVGCLGGGFLLDIGYMIIIPIIQFKQLMRNLKKTVSSVTLYLRNLFWKPKSRHKRAKIQIRITQKSQAESINVDSENSFAKKLTLV